MKKILFVVLCALFIISGCGNKNELKCTGSMTSDGITVDEEYIATFDDNDKLISAKAILTTSDTKSVDQFCGLYELFEDDDPAVKVSCEGNKIFIDRYDMIDTENGKLNGKTREEFKKETEEMDVTCK